MAKYIDSNAFLTKEREWYCKNCIRRTNSKGKIVYEIGEAPCRACNIEDVLDDLENYTAADVRPVVRGEYIGEADGYADGELVYDMWSCSVCGCRYEDWDEKPTYNFCPNCGAQMEGDGKDV